MTPRQDELQSWKEIAGYLGVSVRTSQVWERERGLPVMRLPGPGMRSGVRASVAELERWKRAAGSLSGEAVLAMEAEVAEETPPPVVETAIQSPGVTSLWLKSSIAFCGLVLTVFGAMAALRAPGLASIRAVDSGLYGLDRKGNVLWHKPFGSMRPKRSWMGDVDGDGRVEVLAIPDDDQGLGPVPLICLDAGDGSELWRFSPGREVKLRNGLRLPNVYAARHFLVMSGRIILSSIHRPNSPDQIAVLNAEGQLIREYWHPGHIHAMVAGVYRGKSVVIAGGINNARRAGTMLVLDPETMSGAAVDDGIAAYGMSAGKEEARVIFPRSPLMPETLPYNSVIAVSQGSIGYVAEVSEWIDEPHPPSLSYHLSLDLAVTGIVQSDRYATMFAEQEVTLDQIASLSDADLKERDRERVPDGSGAREHFRDRRHGAFRAGRWRAAAGAFAGGDAAGPACGGEHSHPSRGRLA